MVDPAFLSPAPLITSAVEVGLTAKLKDKQKPKYEALLDALKRLLGKDKDALLALEAVLRRPKSKGARLLLEEELSTVLTVLPPTEQSSDLVGLAEAFLAEVKPELINQQVITQSGKYNINLGQSSGIVIGDTNNVTNESY